METILDQLRPIFPNLTDEVIKISINHPSNNVPPRTPQSVFQCCIDDLLELRTYTQSSGVDQTRRQGEEDRYNATILIESDDDLEQHADMESHGLPAGKQAKNISSSESKTGAKTSESSLPSCCYTNYATSTHTFENDVNRKFLSRPHALQTNSDSDSGDDSLPKLFNSTARKRERSYSSPQKPVLKPPSFITTNSSSCVVDSELNNTSPALFSSPLRKGNSQIEDRIPSTTVLKPSVLSPSKFLNGNISFSSAPSSSPVSSKCILKPPSFSPSKQAMKPLLSVSSSPLSKPSPLSPSRPLIKPSAFSPSTPLLKPLTASPSKPLLKPSKLSTSPIQMPTLSKCTESHHSATSNQHPETVNAPIKLTFQKSASGAVSVINNTVTDKQSHKRSHHKSGPAILMDVNHNKHPGTNATLPWDVTFVNNEAVMTSKSAGGSCYKDGKVLLINNKSNEGDSSYGYVDSKVLVNKTSGKRNHADMNSKALVTSKHTENTCYQDDNIQVNGTIAGGNSYMGGKVLVNKASGEKGNSSMNGKVLVNKASGEKGNSSMNGKVLVTSTGDKFYMTDDVLIKKTNAGNNNCVNNNSYVNNNVLVNTGKTSDGKKFMPATYTRPATKASDRETDNGFLTEAQYSKQIKLKSVEMKVRSAQQDRGLEESYDKHAAGSSLNSRSNLDSSIIRPRSEIRSHPVSASVSNSSRPILIMNYPTVNVTAPLNRSAVDRQDERTASRNMNQTPVINLTNETHVYRAVPHINYQQTAPKPQVVDITSRETTNLSAERAKPVIIVNSQANRNTSVSGSTKDRKSAADEFTPVIIVNSQAADPDTVIVGATKDRDSVPLQGAHKTNVVMDRGGLHQGRNETLTGAQEEPPIVIKSPEEKLQEMQNEILMLFPDVEPEYLKNLLALQTGPDGLNFVCNYLLENNNYPKRPKAPVPQVPELPTAPVNKDYYTDYSGTVSYAYKEQCEIMLQNEFRWVSMKDLRSISKLYNEHYAPLHRAFSLFMKEFTKGIKDASKPVYSQASVCCSIPVGTSEKTISVQFLKCPRSIRTLSGLLPELKLEYDFVQQKRKEYAQEDDLKVAKELNEHEYEETGQLIECGCCYAEVPFDHMVQCYEGHLFCQDCLKQYAQESVFGQGKADLICMTEGCGVTFPMSQLNRALPSNILSKYQDRVQEESINLADLADLVRCPHCEFAALLDPNDKVMRCQNSTCMKETCRYCKEEWSEHFGKRCEEIEKKDEVQLRVRFEEKMTEAKIRTCHRCKTKFTKLEGCNRMTCRCGGTMCYICRKPNIDYKHFCQHLREPKTPCNKCQDCFLWSNAEEDDERAIAEIRKQGEEARKEKGYESSKPIGTVDEPPAKRIKVG